MVLGWVIAQAEDAPALSAALREAGMSHTRIDSSGGFLLQGNSTLMVGIEDAEVDRLLELVGRHCQARVQLVVPPVPDLMDVSLALPSVEIEVGGATVFFVPVERFERL